MSAIPLPHAKPKPGSSNGRLRERLRELGSERAIGGKLILAAEKGDLAQIQALLAKGASPLALGDYACSALMGACAEGHLACALALIAAGSDINAINDDGHTALHVAAAGDWVECAQALMDAGADINLRAQPRSESPLFVAACRGSQGCLALLIARSAHLDAPSRLNQTPLFSALCVDEATSAIALLAAGASPLLQLEAPNLESQRASVSLGVACSRSSFKSVDALLDLGVDPNALIAPRFACSPLALALCGSSDSPFINNHRELCVRSLIIAGADIEALSSPALYDHEEPEAPEPPLIIAATFNRLDAALVLLEAGADPSRLSSSGQTCYQVACNRSDASALQTLLADTLRARLERISLAAVAAPPALTGKSPRV